MCDSVQKTVLSLVIVRRISKVANLHSFALPEPSYHSIQIGVHRL